MHQVELKADGFTLLELLVTLAIVGILAAIGVSNYAEYREKAFHTQAISLNRNLETGVEAWVSEDDGSEALNLNWRRFADGEDVFLYESEDFTDYIKSESIPEGMYLWISTNSNCYYDKTECTYNYKFAIQTTHCNSKSGNRSLVHDLKIDRGTGFRNKTEFLWSKATFRC